MNQVEGNKMAKKLLINCASCDARRIREEDYAHYEQININSAALFTCPEAKAVLNRLPVSIDCANVVELGEDVDLRTVNGRCEIRSEDTAPERKFYLFVNGVLTIGSDTGRQLAQCAGMTINGSLVCPEGVYASLAGVKVNGSTACYPDGAIVLKRNAVIDGLFALRAKSALYWAERRLIMVDAGLDAEALKSKGASFRAREAIVAESKVAALADLIDERTELTVVPDGTAVVQDDVALDKGVLRRHGRKLYVIGDVRVPEDGGALDELEYLNVRGDVRVPEQHRERLLELLSGISGDVKTVKPEGAILEDKPIVKLTRRMLEQQTEGVEISDCGIVKLAADIPPELIEARLHIESCGVVECSEEQEDAAGMVSKDVGKIGGKVTDLFGIGAALSGTRVINAAEYVL